MKIKAWVAKDRGGATVVYLYDKPYKRNDATWGNLGDFFVLDDAHVDIDRNLMPSWKDSEPIEVELTITKKQSKVEIMEQEDKDLLLRYLSMALPYGVVIKITSDGGMSEVSYNMRLDAELLADWLHTQDDFKPFLRPLSSMTEDEKMDFYNFCVIDEFVWKGSSDIGYKNQAIIMSNAITWLLKKHFDFMDLIPKGLAIEVSEENNPYKD